MFKLQVKFPNEPWADTVWPARDQFAAERLEARYNKLWGHMYQYRTVKV